MGAYGSPELYPYGVGREEKSKTFCSNCGHEFEGNFCPNCGHKAEPAGLNFDYEEEKFDPYAPKRKNTVKSTNNSARKTKSKSGHFKYFLIGLIGFFIPLAGLLLYFFTRKENTRFAKAILKGSMTMIILSVTLYVGTIAFNALMPNTFQAVVNRIEQQIPTNSSSNQYSQKITDDKAYKENEAEYKAECIDINELGYNEIQRNAGSYTGRKVKALLQVQSVVSGTNQTQFKCFEVGTFNSYIITDNRISSSTRIIEGDYIQVYGTYAGVQRFEILINHAEDYEPVISVRYIEFMDGAEAEDKGSANLGLEVTGYKVGYSDSYGTTYKVTIKNSGGSSFSGYVYVNLYNNDMRFDECLVEVKNLTAGESMIADCYSDNTQYKLNKVTISSAGF